METRIFIISASMSRWKFSWLLCR